MTVMDIKMAPVYGVKTNENTHHEQQFSEFPSEQMCTNMTHVTCIYSLSAYTYNG